jgi:hypothetical protein
MAVNVFKFGLYRPIFKEEYGTQTTFPSGTRTPPEKAGVVCPCVNVIPLVGVVDVASNDLMYELFHGISTI